MKNETFTNDAWYADYVAVQRSLTDERAWEELYYNSYKYVQNYIAKRFRSEFMGSNTVDDVLAETYERCYFDRKFFRGDCRFTTWMCAYARYVMLNMISKFTPYQKHIDKYRTEDVADHYDSPLWHLERGERDRFIWMAYDLLNYSHQRLLDCYVLDEITTQEAGELTGLNRFQRKAELEIAVDVLRKRFISLYNSEK